MTERSDGVTDARIQAGKVIVGGLKISDPWLSADVSEPKIEMELCYQWVDGMERRAMFER